MRTGLVIVSLLCMSCSGERSPFCTRWFQLSEEERKGEVREQVEEWREDAPVRGPRYVGFLACVASYVADRHAAVDSACRSVGDLEASLTIGRLTAAGAQACAELPALP